jgi:hypothetical protein
MDPDGSGYGAVVRKVLAAAIGLILGTAGATSALADSVEMTVRSDIGWQPTTLDLGAGQAFTVEYRSGTWTVGYPGLARVGIGGYDAVYDQRIYQGCKILTDQTYGHLLARTGSGAPFLADHDGTFTAPAAGRLEFRINDDDRCLGDNAGAVDLRVGTGTGTGPTTGPTTTPTTNPGSGTTMFTASWAAGLNGWAGDAPWKTLRGLLLNDGTGRSRIAAPFTSAVPDYAAEARIRVISGGRFGLYLRRSDNDRGGYLGIIDAGGGGTQLRNDDDDNCCGIGVFAGGPSFSPGKDWHTYRIEADGNAVRLLIDGAQFVTVTDNKYLTDGRTGLFANGAQLEISAFKVIRLR